MSIARATGDETGPDGRVRRPSLVSVVMPARNARPTLEAQLEALGRRTMPVRGNSWSQTTARRMEQPA